MFNNYMATLRITLFQGDILEQSLNYQLRHPYPTLEYLGSNISSASDLKAIDDG